MTGRIKRDITVRFIPNLLADEGRTLQSFPYDRRWTIRKYLKKSNIHFEDMYVSVNGNEVKSLRQHLQSGDEIVVFSSIELPPFWWGVAKIIYWVAMVSMAVYSVVEALTYQKPKMPSFDTIGEGMDESSPSHTWTGVRTVRNVGGSVPAIIGRYFTGGTVINEYITTDGNKNYLNSLVAIGEGKFRSIVLKRINRNDAVNYKIGVFQSDGYIKTDIDMVKLSSIVHTYTGVNLGAGELSIDNDNETFQGAGVIEAEGKPVSVSSTTISQHVSTVPHNVNKLKYRMYGRARNSFQGSRSVACKIEYTTDGTNWSTVPGTEDSGIDGGYQNQDRISDLGVITKDVTINNCLGIRASIICSASDSDGHVGAYGYVYEISAYGTFVTGDVLSGSAGISIETRLGTNNQTVIPHFEDLHNLHSLNIQLFKNAPYKYTTQQSDVEAFEIRFKFPSGIWQQDGSGNILSWDVTYKIEYRVYNVGNGDEDNWISLGNTTVSDKSRSELARMFRKEGLIAGKYDIRTTKISDNSDFSHNADTYIGSIDEINTDDLEYPNTGLAGIRSLSIEQLSGDSPEYEFEVEKIIMCPKVMNGAVEVDWEDYYWDNTEGSECYKLFVGDTPLTCDGVTYVERFCANPIWGLYEISINTRYGIGDYITTDDNDLDYLLEMSRYCEEKVPDGEGGWEKRFRMDVCIDSPQKALDLVMQLSTIFRGLPFYSDAGKIIFAIDKPDTPVQLFGMGNIASGSFSQTWNSRRDVPNIVQVQFDNKDNYYQQDMISVADDAALQAGKPKNIKQARYYGTKLSYAIRHGRNIINTAKYVKETFNFKAGFGAIIRRCGEVIDIAHDVPQFGLASGRVLTGSTPTLVKLDTTVTIEAEKSYAIRVDKVDGKYEECPVINTEPGDYTEVTVYPAFTFTPSEFDNYSFGELYKVVKPARIMSLKRPRRGSVEIEATEHNVNAYDDSAVVLPELIYSALTLEIPDVTNLKLTECLVKMPDGTIADAIDVWFSRPDISTSYKLKRYDRGKIYLSSDNGVSYSYVGVTSGEHFQIVGGLSDLQSYKVAVVSVSVNGEEKVIVGSPTATITIVGKSAKPSDVYYFNVKQFEDELEFSWLPVFDVDIKGYELRLGATWDLGMVVDTIFVGTTYRTKILPLGLCIFWLKVVDTSGNYSQTAISATIIVTRRPGLNIIAAEYEWGRFGSPTEMFYDENIQLYWDNFFNSAYNKQVLTGKTVHRYDDGEFMYDADYEWDVPKTVGAHYVRQGGWTLDFGAILTVMHSVLVSSLSDEGVIFIYEESNSNDGINWTDWKIYTPGFVTMRHFRWKLTVILLGARKLSEFYFSISIWDMPDVKYSMKDIPIAAEGTNIVFDRPFVVIPTVFPSAVKAGSALIPVIDPAYIYQLGIFGVKLRDQITNEYVAGNLNLYLEGF